jgi:hypothetical protein
VFKRFRRRVLPAAHRPAFDPHERVLAWAMTSSDQAVIATNLGLWWGGEPEVTTRSGLPSPQIRQATRHHRRTGWHEISKAKWDGTVLSVITSKVVERREGYDVIVDEPPVRMVLEEPGHLPHQVNLRVTGSVAHPRQFALGWLAARRVPGKDGLSWIVRYEPGVDRSSAEVIAETDAIFKETYWRIVGGSE